jgi:ABC-type nitrate/sulfonate/bicarbonate transport system substrate-binding protein
MRRGLKIWALVGAIALILTACGDDAGETDSTGTTGAVATTDAPSEEPGVVTHAAGSPADVYIPQYRAPELFGELFNISTENNYTAFEDGNLAAQVAVAGDVDIASGGFTPVVQVIEQGQPAKAFCPVQMDSTEHLVGRTDVITDLEQITEPNVRVAVESAGGFLNLLMNMVFDARGMGITTDDLTNTVIIEDGGQRLAALGAGDVDVGSLDLFEQAELKETLGEDAVTVLSVVAEDADFIANVMWAPTEWLEENQDLAARYCAAVIYSNRQLTSDYDQYLAALEEFGTSEIDEETVRTNREFIRQHEVFPLNATVISEENIRKLIDLSVATGIFEESSADLQYEDVVDTAVIDLTQQYLGGDVTLEQVVNGEIPEPNVP